jgi:hypothetical protein
MVFLAKDQLFDTAEDAIEYANSVFINLILIPYGLTSDGLFEAEVDEDGKAMFPHIRSSTPIGCDVAIIGGAAFDKKVAKEKGEGKAPA